MDSRRPMINVYVATKFQNVAGFNEMKRLLEDIGHKVTHDWTKESADGKGWPERYPYLQKCALRDGHGVADSDCLIFIPVNQPMAGAFVEMGIALALDKLVIVVDAFADGIQGNIFYYLPQVVHVKTLKEAASEVLRHYGRGLGDCAQVCPETSESYTGAGQGKN